jgi:hypothetical protein
MPPALLVYALEIGVTQKPRVAGKGALAGSRRNLMVRSSRHTGSHRDSKFQIAIPQMTVKNHRRNSE